VLVEIWSDVVCPWCYIGKRRFEAALALFDHDTEVEVRWRSFELDPAAPPEREGAYVERLAKKYRVPVAEAQAMIDHMTASASDEGLGFRFELARPGNTFDAHRLLHLAQRGGLQDAMKERLLAATFTEGQPIGDHETLVTLAVDVGLDADAVRRMLASDEVAAEVRADEERAVDLGITAVPFFVFDKRFGLSGAQQPRHLAKALATAWREAHPLTSLGEPGDGACEGDSCAV